MVAAVVGVVARVVGTVGTVGRMAARSEECQCGRKNVDEVAVRPTTRKSPLR